MFTYGDHLISPRATAQLQREIIEYASADGAAPSIDRDTLVHLLLSITSEQNMRPRVRGRRARPPPKLRSFNASLPKMGLEEMHEYAKPLIQDEIASALFNVPLKLRSCCPTPTTCGSPRGHRDRRPPALARHQRRPSRSPPASTCSTSCASGPNIKRSTDAHQVRFTRDELLADGAAEGAIDYLFANMAMSLDDFKVELQEDRDAGAIGHQRYTLTQYPFLAVDDNTFVMLRHQWALDRLCGGQLYFEAWASLVDRPQIGSSSR